MKLIPRYITVEFGKESVWLEKFTDHAKTKSGVEIYIQPRPGNEYKPIAICPDGTLNEHMHHRPRVINVEWVEA